jgi:hypothetical protein
VIPERERLLAALADEAAAALRRRAYLQEDVPPALARIAPGRLRLVRSEPDRIELAAAMPGPGLLVVTNTHSPYWRCRVDGRERPILPAYGTFWAVPLDRPARRIEFSYEPPYRWRR